MFKNPLETPEMIEEIKTLKASVADESTADEENRAEDVRDYKESYFD